MAGGIDLSFQEQRECGVVAEIIRKNTKSCHDPFAMSMKLVAEELLLLSAVVFTNFRTERTLNFVRDVLKTAQMSPARQQSHPAYKDYQAAKELTEKFLARSEFHPSSPAKVVTSGLVFAS